ncbi:DUF6350 family protein, partial [Streptomyces sp. WAC04114]|uniref:cell division protein PerM n=1 Tax=Streptomyces sp. WAC04114 TaxID=2867961 RepID=UPI0035AB6B38|nr:hypothetical protein [Streptomyces sp. WAC04114]
GCLATRGAGPAHAAGTARAARRAGQSREHGRAQHRRPCRGADGAAGRPEGRPRAAALSSVLCAAVLAGLAGLSGGPLGAGVLSRFGPVWWQAAAATLAWLVLLAIPTAVGVRAWRCRSLRTEEATTGKRREHTGGGPDGPGRLRKGARLGRGRFTRTGVAGIAGVAGGAGGVDGTRGAGRADRARGAASSAGDEDVEDFWGAGVGDGSRGIGAAYGLRDQGRETDYGPYDFLPSDRPAPPESA